MSAIQENVTLALETLVDGLRPYVERQLRDVFGEDWLEIARGSFRNDRANEELSENVVNWDAHALLTVMWDQWNAVFRRRLNLFERSLVAELRAFRNRWAHQKSFNFDDTYRLLDSVQRLLSKVEAPNVDRISDIKFDLLREEFGEAINESARQAENLRERWVVSFVYLICGLVFVILIPETFQNLLGHAGWGLSAAVGIAFLYLIYRRLKEKPIRVGPHECRRCRKIIYGTSCPYCSVSSGFDATDFRLGGLDNSDAAEDEQPERSAAPR